MAWIIALHNRTPLFIKVLGANGLFVVVATLGGFTIARFGFHSENVLWFVALGLLISQAVNYLLLRVAFRPLFQLQRVMEKVRAGEVTARSPGIPGDPDVHNLVETFNLMLDRLEVTRSQVLRAIEEERKRIARELHDETSQALTSIIISLEVTEQALPPSDPMRERIAHARDYTLRTLEEVRRLTFDLRPSILDDLGLVPAIRWYVKNRLTADNLTVDLHVAPEVEDIRLPEEMEVTVFRIIQEALTNVRRHSGATEVRVTIGPVRGRLVARVQDNGRGFVLEEVRNQDQKGRGLGLLGMRERAALVGGAVRVESSPGRGTAVTVEVPVDAR